MALSFILGALAAIGVTDRPCPLTLELPPELIAWRTAVYAPDNRRMLPTPLAAIAYGDAYRAARKIDWADLCRYRAVNAKLAAAPAAARSVVLIGDSITEAWEFADPQFAARGWIDRGISGQTTQQILLRFPADVLALHPRVVHIMAGTNDVAGNGGPTTLDAIEANLAAMVVLAKADGIRVVLAAVPPAASFGWAPELRPTPVIAALNARLRALAIRERVDFVDYGEVLATPEGAMRDELSLDGVHPNAAGYAAMAPLARRAIIGQP